MVPIVRLRDCDPAIVNAVRDLYEASFPASERSDFTGIHQEDAADERDVLVLLEQGQVRGLCVTSRLSWPALFIEYFAVAPDHRGTGVGSRFLRECLLALITPAEHGAVLEIERVEASPGDPYRPVRRRFWEKSGARAVVERFVVPRLDGAGGMMDMTLMWIAADGHPLPDPRALARQVLEEGYGLEPTQAAALLQESLR